MNKSFLIAALVALGAPVAFAAPCEVELIMTGGRVLNTFRGHYDRQSQCSDAMYRCQQEASQVRTRANCVERTVYRPDPRPYPGPRPEPRPDPRPIPTSDLNVSIVLENTAYKLSGYNATEVHRDCVSQLSYGFVRSDEFTLVTNNSRIRRQTTSGWWYNASEVCALVYNNIDAYSDSYGPGVSANGDIEGYGFYINTRDKADALIECANAYNRTGLSQADDIRIAVNGRHMQHLRNGSSYWKTTSSVCHEVMRAIDNSSY